MSAKASDRGLEREINHRRDQAAHLGGIHLRDKLVEDQRHPRTNGNMAVILRERDAAHAASDFDVLQDVMMLLRAIVELKENPVGLNLELGDHHAVSGLGGDAVFLQLVGIAASRRAEPPIGMEHDAASAQRKGPHSKSLVCLECTNQLLPGALRDRSGIKLDGRGLNRGEIYILGPRCSRSTVNTWASLKRNRKGW